MAEVGGVSDPDAPLATTALWAPYCVGFKGAQTKTLVTEFATPAGALQSAAPLTGAPAIGRATSGNVACFDITGTPRADTIAALARTDFSAGAWEVALEA